MTPKVYLAKWTPSRFVLVMEDLSSQGTLYSIMNNGSYSFFLCLFVCFNEGVEFPNIWSKNVTKPLAKQVLTTLAKIHATYWVRRKERKKERKKE